MGALLERVPGLFVEQPGLAGAADQRARTHALEAGLFMIG